MGDFIYGKLVIFGQSSLTPRVRGRIASAYLDGFRDLRCSRRVGPRRSGNFDDETNDEKIGESRSADEFGAGATPENKGTGLTKTSSGAFNLGEYDKIVKEALAGWERSCQTGSQSVRITDKEGSNGTERETVRQVERGPGDVRFIDACLKGLAEIRTLYGIGVPGSDPTIGSPGTIRIATEWGGELGKADQSADSPAVAGGEKAEQASGTEPVGGGPKKPVR